MDLEDEKKMELKASNNVVDSEPEEDETRDKDKIIKELQRKLKVVETSYKELETTVKELQEEKETLKIDVKDLTEYIQKK